MCPLPVKNNKAVRLWSQRTRVILTKPSLMPLLKKTRAVKAWKFVEHSNALETAVAFWCIKGYWTQHNCNFVILKKIATFMKTELKLSAKPRVSERIAQWMVLMHYWHPALVCIAGLCLFVLWSRSYAASQFLSYKNREDILPSKMNWYL